MTVKSRLQLSLKTAERFRDFSKKNNSNQSETLDLMLDFFLRKITSPLLKLWCLPK